MSLLGLGGALAEVPGLVARGVAWLRGMGPIAGGVAAGLGLVLLVAAHRLRRPVALLGGAAVGWLAALAGAGLLPSGLSPGSWGLVAAAVCGVASALAPWLFPASAGALVGALLGGHLALGGRPALGAAVAAALGAALLALLARGAAAVLSALAGGLLLGAGLLGLGGGRPLAAELAARPLVVVGFALVLGIAGAAFQLSGARAGKGARDGRLSEPPRLPRS